MLTVSKLARRCGLSRSTLLYYESIGLLRGHQLAILKLLQSSGVGRTKVITKERWVSIMKASSSCRCRGKKSAPYGSGAKRLSPPERCCILFYREDAHR